MKTEVLFAVRCSPTITKRKLEAIKSPATAFITELIRNKKGEQIVSTKGFIKVADYEEMIKGAKMGKNIIYKTASLAGCAKFYVQK